MFGKKDARILQEELEAIKIGFDALASLDLQNKNIDNFKSIIKPLTKRVDSLLGIVEQAILNHKDSKDVASATSATRVDHLLGMLEQGIVKHEDHKEVAFATGVTTHLGKIFESGEIFVVFNKAQQILKTYEGIYRKATSLQNLKEGLNSHTEKTRLELDWSILNNHYNYRSKKVAWSAGLAIGSSSITGVLMALDFGINQGSITKLPLSGHFNLGEAVGTSLGIALVVSLLAFGLAHRHKHRLARRVVTLYEEAVTSSESSHTQAASN